MSEKTYSRGDIIASLYEVREVHAGGFGEVYVAYHRERKRLYALKTIREKLFRTKEEFLAFRREAEIWLMLGKHPNVVQAVSIRDFEGRLFLVLEYIEPDSKGRNSLSHYLTGKLLDSHQVLLWALQFCDGMIYAYQKGLKCHRDIKPGNIMISKDMVVKIADFGLAKTADISEPKPAAKNGASSVALGKYDITEMVGNIRGTPAYMAPEVFQEYQNADEVSDIYSFGVVLFQMVSGGERPFTPGASGFEIYQYLHENSPVPELDSPLFPIVIKCLAKRRKDRYRSFAELRSELENSYHLIIGDTPPSPMEVKTTSEDIRNFSHALFDLKHYGAALERCEQALVMDKNDYETWNLRGRICYALKRYDAALEAFHESIRLKQDFFAPWNNKGMILQEQGRTEEALACFRKVISLRPDYREAWNNIGVCIQMQSDWEEAIKNYQKAVELDPRYRDAWLNMGDCYITLRRYHEALGCYEKAEQVDPHDSYTLENLERLYQLLGFSEKAAKIRDTLKKEKRK